MKGPAAFGDPLPPPGKAGMGPILPTPLQGQSALPGGPERGSTGLWPHSPPNRTLPPSEALPRCPPPLARLLASGLRTAPGLLSGCVAQETCEAGVSWEGPWPLGRPPAWPGGPHPGIRFWEEGAPWCSRRRRPPCGHRCPLLGPHMCAQPGPMWPPSPPPARPPVPPQRPPRRACQGGGRRPWLGCWRSQESAPNVNSKLF